MTENYSAEAPLKIFLCDLTHTGQKTRLMPLGVGLIASYSLKKFGKKIDVRLFKDPNKLYEILQHEKCDILGCATYVWNHNLNLWACRAARKFNPSVVTCLGGPDFPMLDDQLLTYFRENDCVDFYVEQEGEVAFSHIVEKVLNMHTKSDLFDDMLEGCIFYNEQKNALVRGQPIKLMDLDEIPSPYTTGLFDEFFDGNYYPIIYTTRGCPFTCNFCVQSDAYFNKIRRTDRSEVIKDLHYIAERISDTPAKNLYNAESNFGMYKHDKIVSETIAELQHTHGWPLTMFASSGKNFDAVMDNTKAIHKSFEFCMSVQSMDMEVLEEIGRKNIPPHKYKKASEVLQAAGQSTLGETIVPLPKETLQTYLDGVKTLIEWGVKRLVTNNLMVLYGTDYKNPAYIKKYGYTTQYRLLNSDFGTYGGEKVFEFEEIGMSTNSLTFEDNMAVRKISFLLEVMYNNSILIELELYLAEKNLSYFDFIMAVSDAVKSAPDSVQAAFKSFDDESHAEAKDTSADIIEFYSKDENYSKLLTGELGGNVKFNHKAMLLSSPKEEWIDFVFACLQKTLEDAQCDFDQGEIAGLHDYVSCRLAGVLDEEAISVVIEKNFSHDFEAWINQTAREKKLSEFRVDSSINYKFYFNDAQRAERKDLFMLHNAKELAGLAHIVGAIRPQYRLFRNVERLQ